MKAILDTASAQLLSGVGTTLERLLALTGEIQNDSLEHTVQDMLDQLETPFTFVIVGEVKAGKSSFINALLDTDKEICKVAPSPMTDTIQLIIYGENESTTEINPYLKRIEQPVEILREIAIVDTPGTNTIVDHHQEITERFIPHSDLIVFVFEAKNPYRQSSWEFFDYINEEWRRKIIFVLQQKDLMEVDDLQVNLKGVQDQAEKKGIEQPAVFAVSAKQELEGKKEESGFKNIRDYIARHITGGKAPVLKAQNNARTASTIIEKIAASLDLRRRQWEADQAFRSGITETIEDQSRKTSHQVDMLIENLIATYDRISGETFDKLAEGMGFFSVMKRSVSSIFGSTESLKTWLTREAKDFEHKLNAALRHRLQQGIVDVADNIQTMAKLVHSQLKDSKMILSDSDEIFSNIAERRANVLKELQESFASFMQDSENFYDEQLVQDSGNVAPNMAAGSGLAIVGVILATITNGAVFDITGGILTTVGVLFAGVSLGLKRKKILRGFKAEIQRGRERLSFEVKERLITYTESISQRIDDNFFQLDRLLDHEAKTLDKFESQQSVIQAELDEHLNKAQRLLN